MTLESIESALATVTDARDFFEPDKDRALRDYRAILHPDRYPGEPDKAARADKARKKLEEMYDFLKKPIHSLKSPKRTYGLRSIMLRNGDVSDVWLANTETEEELRYLLKVSRVPEGAAILKAEATNLKKVLAAAGTSVYAELLPVLCESFPIRDGMQKMVNVFLREEGLYTLEQVKAKHGAVDHRHVAWIFKRLVSVLGLAHRAGIVHGAVLPQHVLINPVTHKIVLVGWGQSVAIGGVVKYGSASHRDVYPVEIVNKHPVGPGTDICMAARCACWLTSSMPNKMGQFFRSCMLGGLKMRPTDAWELHDQFDVCLREIYGKPRYVLLEM